MRNDMSSVCWTLTATCLDCTWLVDWGSSPHRGSTFWTHLRFCCISPDSVFCNIVSFSCCLHFPSQNTSFCLFLSLHYWKYHTGIGWFLTKALFFITIGWYFLFSATMSHATPWHCDDFHPNPICTVQTYSEGIAHSQQVSSESRHNGASPQTNDTSHHYPFFLSFSAVSLCSDFVTDRTRLFLRITCIHGLLWFFSFTIYKWWEQYGGK